MSAQNYKTRKDTQNILFLSISTLLTSSQLGLLGFDKKEKDLTPFFRHISEDFVSYVQDMKNKDLFFASFSRAPISLIEHKSQIISNSKLKIFYWYTSNRRCKRCENIGHSIKLCPYSDCAEGEDEDPESDGSIEENPITQTQQSTSSNEKSQSKTLNQTSNSSNQQNSPSPQKSTPVYLRQGPFNQPPKITPYKYAWNPEKYPKIRQFFKSKGVDKPFWIGYETEAQPHQVMDHLSNYPGFLTINHNKQSWHAAFDTLENALRFYTHHLNAFKIHELVYN